jgi:hypothetical protein
MLTVPISWLILLGYAGAITMLTVLLAILCAVLMLVGLAGVVLPFLPGIPLAWLGLFIYAIGTGFERVSIPVVVVFSVLTVLTLALDFIAPMLGAKRYRASRLGVLGAFLGFVIGVITSGPLGIILGPFLGALAGELLASRKPSHAFRSALGAFLGFMAGSLVKIVVILVMMGFFVASLF